MACTLELKDFLSSLATLLSAGGAAWAVTRTLKANRASQELTIKASRQNQDRKQAFDAYDAYLELCFEHPKFANGQLIDQGFSIPSRDEYDKADALFYKYEWFVARLLIAAEQILDAVPGDKEWRDTIWWQVRKHYKYIQCEHFKPRIKIYSPPLRAIINEVASKFPSTNVEGAQ
jgi:hypothetical protein